MLATKLADGIIPGIFGNFNGGMITWTGPSSYTQVSTGATPSGGQSIPASAFGLKFLDAIICISLDSTGAYGVEAIITKPGGSTTAILLWFVGHTGAEAAGSTNLSAISVVLLGIGR